MPILARFSFLGYDFVSLPAKVWNVEQKELGKPYNYH